MFNQYEYSNNKPTRSYSIKYSDQFNSILASNFQYKTNLKPMLKTLNVHNPRSPIQQFYCKSITTIHIT